MKDFRIKIRRFVPVLQHSQIYSSMQNILHSSKLPDVGTTIFSVMTQYAQQYGAINLAQGFPDFPCSELLIEYAAQAMRDQHNQYAPMPGLPALREKLSAKAASLYGQIYNPDTEITITPGATAALFCALHAVLKPSDEVLVFEPCYDSYTPAIQLAGAVSVRTQLVYPRYSINWDDVQSKITSKTRVILLNTPHNPTGAIWSESDIQRLQELVRDTNIVLISDEVYEHIMFDGLQHCSIARYPELSNRSLIVYSFGKTYHVTGWKIGYCMAPEYLMREFRKVHQFVTFCTHAPSQHAFAKILENPALYEELGMFYQRKRDIFRSLMNGSRFELLPCSGSYFQMASYKTISNEPDTHFTLTMAKEHGVAAIPVSVFYQDGTDNRVIRFCFAKSDKTLHSAAELLHRL